MVLTDPRETISDLFEPVNLLKELSLAPLKIEMKKKHFDPRKKGIYKGPCRNCHGIDISLSIPKESTIFREGMVRMTPWNSHEFTMFGPDSHKRPFSSIWKCTLEIAIDTMSLGIFLTNISLPENAKYLLNCTFTINIYTNKGKFIKRVKDNATCTLRTWRVKNISEEIVDGVWFDLFHRFSCTKNPCWLKDGMKITCSMMVIADHNNMGTDPNALIEGLNKSIRELHDPLKYWKRSKLDRADPCNQVSDKPSTCKFRRGSIDASNRM